VLAGASFEERIRREKAGEPKFNFLKQGDPYFNYFQMKVVCMHACVRARVGLSIHQARM
jgi:hypothetical protein